MLSNKNWLTVNLLMGCIVGLILTDMTFKHYQAMKALEARIEEAILSCKIEEARASIQSVKTEEIINASKSKRWW